MSKYRSTVLPEDEKSVEEAQKTYKLKVSAVYAYHRQAVKLGMARHNSEIGPLADQWQAEAEMVVATTFDLKYLPAQVTYRDQQSIDTTELQQIIADTQARHDAAQAKLPDLTARLQKLYDSLKSNAN